MRIMTDSAADFTTAELREHAIRCIPTQVTLDDIVYTPGKDLTSDELWVHLLAGETCRTSQPAPSAFLDAFDESDEEAVCICISSALSGTLQSARIAQGMASAKIHLVDSLTGAAAQKLLVLHACRLRDKMALTAREIAQELESLRSRIRLFASLDTLDNLARSGRIPRAAAAIGTLAQLKPLLHVTEDGRIAVCGKAIGRRMAIDALARRIAAFRIDPAYPVIPLYSYARGNCTALIGKLASLGVTVQESLMSAIGPAIAGHIGPNAYGVAFVEAE